MRIQIEVSENVTARLRSLARLASNLTPVMKDIATRLDDATHTRFQNESGPDRVPWQKSKRVIEKGGKTLHLTGALEESIAPVWGPNHAAVDCDVSSSAALYAAVHQWGARIRSRNRSITIPARPFLGFDRADIDMVHATFADHITSALGVSNSAETTT